MINTENIAAGMSVVLCYLSFGFTLRVLFVKGKWDHKSALQRAKGREDRNFQQVAWKKMLPKTGFPWKEMPARILPRYIPHVVVTAKSVSRFLAGALILAQVALGLLQQGWPSYGTFLSHSFLPIFS